MIIGDFNLKLLVRGLKVTNNRGLHNKRKDGAKIGKFKISTNTKKSVILVEGQDDKIFYEKFISEDQRNNFKC